MYALVKVFIIWLRISKFTAIAPKKLVGVGLKLHHVGKF